MGDFVADFGIFQAGVDRDGLIRLEGIGYMVTQILGQFELGFDFHDFVVISFVLAQILAGGLVHVHNPLRGLEPGDLIFHTA